MVKSHILLFIVSLLATFGSARSDKSFTEKFGAFHRIVLSDRAESRGDTGEEPSATDSILRLWLSPQMVYDYQPVFNTFYFWTNFLDLDSSLQQNQLLRTSVSNDLDIERYQENLRIHSKYNEPIVDHLMGGQRQRVRSAWPCYWQNIDYDTAFPRNHQLVQVILMDSSLIVSYFPDKKKKERWRVQDLRGNLITLENALLRKRHIAAVFISDDDKMIFTGPRRTVFHEHYRTFILCNEDMIKSWHHAVPGVQAKVMQDFDYLALMYAWFENTEHALIQNAKGKNCYEVWTTLSTQRTVAEMYFGTVRRAGILGPNANQNDMKEVLDAMGERFRTQMMPCERYPGKK